MTAEAAARSPAASTDSGGRRALELHAKCRGNSAYSTRNDSTPTPFQSMQKLTPVAQVMLAVIAVGSTFGAVRTYGHSGPASGTRGSSVAPAHSPARPVSSSSGTARAPG